MKALLLAGLLLAGTAHAEIYCAITAENAKEEMVFDHVLFEGPVNDQQLFVVAPHAAKVSRFPTDGHEIIRQWPEIKKGTVISITPIPENNSIAIGAMKMKGAANPSTGTSTLLSMANTGLEPRGSSLSLYVPQAKVFVSCTRVN